MAATATDSCAIVEPMEANRAFTRRELLGITGIAGVAALTGTASSAVAQTAQKRPRIACLVSYWGATRSHADWIVTKLLDGYWWQGAHTLHEWKLYLFTSTSLKQVCWVKRFANRKIFQSLKQWVKPSRLGARNLQWMVL